MFTTHHTEGSDVLEIIAVSGGPDSVYLVCKTLKDPSSTILAHVNHGARGRDSDEDQKFVQRLGRSRGMPVEVRKITMTKNRAGFEKKARDERYAFLRDVKSKHGAGRILLAHTADDQVETVLMRILEGSGVSGLKGIPRRTENGIERPLLDTWREDILKYLHKHKIPFRIDRSNRDTRFERNWIRHVLVPLLEKRYGKPLKRRILTLGERFREIDEYLEFSAKRWMKKNVSGRAAGRRASARERAIVLERLDISRKPYGALPSALRKKILQLLCFERIGVVPNERLLESMDRNLVSGRPSARLNIGKGAVLRCRYDKATVEIVPTEEHAPGTRSTVSRTRTLTLGKTAETGDMALVWERKGKLAMPVLRRLAQGERASAFDAEGLSAPLAIRALRPGDRIRPFGLDAEKKVKEILIDRKVPRDERWGRPVVCDAYGRILWIPGVVRSAHAPITGKTRRTAVLRLVGKGGDVPVAWPSNPE